MRNVSLFFASLILLSSSAFIVSSFAAQQQISQKETNPSFSKSFPHFRDPTTGFWVYQISKEPGMNRTFYYHQAQMQQYDSVIYENLPPGAHFMTYIQVNLYTGERKALADLLTGGFFQHGRLYGYYHSLGGTRLEMLDIKSGKWQMILPIKQGWIEEGAVAVNSDDTYLIYSVHSRAEEESRRIFMVEINSGKQYLLYEGRKKVEHFQFSPSEPGIFTYIDQSVGREISRIGVGSVRQKEIAPFKIEAKGEGHSYFSEAEFHGANFGHPFWGMDGLLWSDVLWHRMDPPDSYALVSFKLEANSFGAVVVSQEMRLFVPGLYWQVHFNRGLNKAWFVGDGDPFSPEPHKVPGEGMPAISLLHFGKEGVDFYPLATIQGNCWNVEKKRHIDPCSHLVAGGRGIITTFYYDYHDGKGKPTDYRHSQVFLIEIPEYLQKQIH